MTKNRIIVVVLLILFFLLVSGCRSKPQDYMLSKEEAQQERIKDKTGLANPATLYCLNQIGTTWEIRDSEAGQYGICIFPDGSWCEEWAYYKGYCSPGTNLTSCEGQAWGKTICPPSYNPVCAKIEIGTNTPYEVKWEEFSNACNACKSSTRMEVVVGYVLGECE